LFSLSQDVPELLVVSRRRLLVTSGQKNEKREAEKEKSEMMICQVSRIERRWQRELKGRRRGKKDRRRRLSAHHLVKVMFLQPQQQPPSLPQFLFQSRRPLRYGFRE